MRQLQRWAAFGWDYEKLIRIFDFCEISYSVA
jgi:hypothetical protein